MLVYLDKKQSKQRDIRLLIEQLVMTIHAKLIQKKKKKLIDFLESQSQQSSNKRKLDKDKSLRQKSQHQNRKKSKSLDKEHIKRVQYVSLTTTTKLNNTRTMFYHIS